MLPLIALSMRKNTAVIMRVIFCISMTRLHALQALFIIGFGGLLFSGILSYQEVFGTSAIACPSPGAPGTVLGYPACVYGFFMYLAIVTISFFGLRSSK